MIEKRCAPESGNCMSGCHDWAWPQLPSLIAWRCDAWPDLGECTNDRRFCTSPRRNQCRHGVFLRPSVCQELPW